jgi:hypothetical protein
MRLTNSTRKKLLFLRLQSRYSLDVRIPKPESSKECGASECNANNEALPEPIDVGLEHSLKELLWYQTLQLGRPSIQDDLGVKAWCCDGELLEQCVLKGSLGGRDPESAVEGSDDYNNRQ